MKNYLKRRITILLMTVFALCIGSGVFANDGFMPSWNKGDTWFIEAKYINLKDGVPSWLPAIKWRFEVKTQKAVEGEPCWIIHITPESRPDMKVQAILCLAVSDLRPVKVVDIYPLQGKARSKVKKFNNSALSPLFSEDSMIPYDFPMFPLNATLDEAGSANVGGEKTSEVDDIVFVENVSQKWESVQGQYQITIQDAGAKGSITQTWKNGAPWAVEMKSQSVVYSLVQE
ncbi:MAG: hypothetical protein HQM10_18680 [Candidatus Riflebacteria bacterium]|nr:hypothetical protein [Candidatus Riflebacteria bacterium]